MRITHLITFALALAFGLAMAPMAQARENHAILIGASTYPNLDEQYWLKGPANDVDLVRTYLLNNPNVQFQADNIAILADGVPGGTAPTLAAIRTAMADLANRLQADDFVYLHFSGHGSQAPARDPDSELDGLDELFLPVDIGPWDDTVGVVENALVDDEIGQMIAALRASGATVWAVFDSCYSGTVTRAAPTGNDDVRLRKLDSRALGIPDNLMEKITSRALGARPASPIDIGQKTDGKTDGETGSFVAFYAAQTTETTPEKRLPRGMPGRRSQGVFTYTLFEALAARPAVSYRQLGQEILRRYAVDNLARATPMFEGDLDAPVFASGNRSQVQQWPLQRIDGQGRISAGRLHGLTQGATLAIMASPADADKDALGLMQIDFADTFSARLLPVSGGPQLDQIPRGAYLRKLRQSLAFSLTVALPEPGSIAATRLADALTPDAIAGLFGPRIALVPAGAEADLRLAVLPDGDRPTMIHVLTSTGILEQTGFTTPPRIETTGKTAPELAAALGDTLQRIARVQNLLKLGGAFGNSLDSGAVDVEISLQTRSPSSPRLQDLETLPVPRLVPDDEVHVLARNREDIPVDLNVLYVGSDYSITHMFAGRLQPGDRLKQGLLRITDAAFGRDRIILILSPAQKQTAIEDLSFLQQDELPPTRQVGPASFTAILAEAGFGAQTRAAVALGGGSSTGPGPVILMFDFDTRPDG